MLQDQNTNVSSTLCSAEPNQPKACQFLSKIGLNSKSTEFQKLLEGSRFAECPAGFKHLLEAAAGSCKSLKELLQLWVKKLLRDGGAPQILELDSSARATISEHADNYIRATEVLAKFNADWLKREVKADQIVDTKECWLAVTQLTSLFGQDLLELLPQAAETLSTVSAKLQGLVNVVRNQLFLGKQLLRATQGKYHKVYTAGVETADFGHPLDLWDAKVQDDCKKMGEGLGKKSNTHTVG